MVWASDIASSPCGAHWCAFLSLRAAFPITGHLKQQVRLLALLRSFLGERVGATPRATGGTAYNRAGLSLLWAPLLFRPSSGNALHAERPRFSGLSMIEQWLR